MPGPVIEGAYIQLWPAASGAGALTNAYVRGAEIDVAGADYLDVVIRVLALGAPTPLARVDLQIDTVSPGPVYERVAVYGALVAGVYTIEVPTWQLDVSALPAVPGGRSVRFPVQGLKIAVLAKASAVVSPSNSVQILGVRRNGA
jgi:hypothetical protein